MISCNVIIDLKKIIHQAFLLKISLTSYLYFDKWGLIRFRLFEKKLFLNLKVWNLRVNIFRA